MTEKGILCEGCGAFVKEGELAYHRKHEDENFCSRECLQKYVTANLEIRPHIIN